MWSAGIFCFSCGHGGHTAHLKSWFQQFSECPTGCGCRCADAASLESKPEAVDRLNENHIQFADVTASALNSLNGKGTRKTNARDDESDLGSENSDSDDSRRSSEDANTPPRRYFQ